MTFHWTSLEIGTLAVEGAIFAGWLASRILGRADKRDADVSPRRAPGARYVDAAGFPGPVTPRSVLGEPVRFPTAPLTVAEIERYAADAVEELEAYSNLQFIAATPQRVRNEAVDEIADVHRMPRRPEPPDPEPDEPWQLGLPADAYPPHQVPGRKNLPSRLVERADTEHDTPGGETS